MKRLWILMSVVAMVASFGCKTSDSQQRQPTPSESIGTQESSAESDAELADADEEAERGGPHSEQIEVSLAEEPTVTGPGTLNPMAIANLAEKRQQRTVTCFENLEGDLDEPSRQVMLTLRLSLDGVVLEVQSSAQDELGECVAAEVKRWNFPKPEGGEVESTIKFDYQTSGDEENEGSNGGE